MQSCRQQSRALFSAALPLFAAFVLESVPGHRLQAADTADGVALAIVYDTSGSMRDTVRTADGQRAAKYIIANRALEQIIRRVERFATNSAVPHTIHTGLFVFKGTGVQEAVKFGPFNADQLMSWVKTYRGPDSGTPLGGAVDAASRAVLFSKLNQKHVLVITDGINTAGPDPVTVIPQLQQQADRRHTSVFIHFIAFDIDAKVFTPIKRLGVDVVGAADEKQLDQQLEFMLEEKILLEREDKK